MREGVCNSWWKAVSHFLSIMILSPLASATISGESFFLSTCPSEGTARVRPFPYCANCGTAASQTFSYDPFGNLSKSGSPYSFQPTYSTSTNQMTNISGFTPTYDSNGDVTNDSNHTYAWDADGNPITLDSVNLTYDALDRVVEQNRSGSYTQVVYAPNGAKLALRFQGLYLQTLR